MNVVLSKNAEDHLDAIYAHISRDSDDLAGKVLARIKRRAEQIALFPTSGRIVPELGFPQIREVFEHPYRIMYVISAENIEILAVLHEAMDSFSENL